MSDSPSSPGGISAEGFVGKSSPRQGPLGRAGRAAAGNGRDRSVGEPPGLPPREASAPGAEPAPAPAPVSAPAPKEESNDSGSGGGSAYYKNCDAARAAGAAPVHAGDPGYSRKLDRDGDGVGCE